MKSLEIVNLYLEELELHECKEMWLYRTSIQQIKQDLEVLEILRKHLEIVEYLGRKDIETYGLNTIKNKEDFNKIKQWLEENE